jgi:hypothetical protein
MFCIHMARLCEALASACRCAGRRWSLDFRVLGHHSGLFRSETDSQQDICKPMRLARLPYTMAVLPSYKVPLSRCTLDSASTSLSLCPVLLVRTAAQLHTEPTTRRRLPLSQIRPRFFTQVNVLNQGRVTTSFTGHVVISTTLTSGDPGYKTLGEKNRPCISREPVKIYALVHATLIAHPQ